VAREKDTFRRSTLDPPFDPEGSGYDYSSAIKAGLKPDDTGHWPSRDPKTGMLLKGSGHLTWGKTLAGEEDEGNAIRRREDGRYYSFPKKTAIAPHPSRVKLLTGEIDAGAVRDKHEEVHKRKEPENIFGEEFGVAKDVAALLGAVGNKKAKHEEAQDAFRKGALLGAVGNKKAKPKKQEEGEVLEKERAEIIREIIDRQAKQAAPKESVVFGLNAAYLGDRTGNEGGQKLTDPKYKGYPLMNRLHQEELDKADKRKAARDWRREQNSDPNAWG